MTGLIHVVVREVFCPRHSLAVIPALSQVSFAPDLIPAYLLSSVLNIFLNAVIDFYGWNLFENVF